MRKLIPYLIFILFFCFSKQSSASHGAAVDLTYTCLGGNQYTFVLKLYRDCAGSTLPTTASLNLFSNNCGQNFNSVLNLDSITEVSQICGAQINNSTCNGGTLPGIQEYVYSATVTLPANCSDWIGSYTLCCRNNAITNINNGNLYTEVQIDNTGGNCNNSPTFNSGIPILYACSGDPVNFNNAAIDVDGDSLTYTLVNPLSGNGTPLTYNDPSFNPNNPMFTDAGFAFDSVTGQITFATSNVQQAVVSVLINEYDSLGNWKGSVMRDIQFIILNCPPLPPPDVSGVNYDSVNYTFRACYTDSFCFDVYGTSGQAGVPMTLTYGGGVPGGTFSTTSANDTTFGTFCWNPGLRTGSYNFTLRGEADVCPITRVNVYNYTIIIDTNFTNCTDSTIYLDNTGQANIDSTHVIGVTNSVCQVQNVWLSQNTFNCSDIGTNSVTVNTLYTNGLNRSCTSNITVLDTLSPNMICQNNTVYLDATGNISINTSTVNNGTTDNCLIDSMWLDNYDFTCANVGANTITLYAIDNSGNIDSCSSSITVIDTVSPNAICQDTTIYLDATGNFTIDSSFIDDGSNDNCAVATITLSQYNFDCSHVGTNPVTMTVTDVNGNVSTCNANVVVVDTVNPNPICQNSTIYLDATGNFTIDSSYINNGSNDNCAVATITLSQYNFDCSHVGANNITMTVTDVNGNIDSCSATVTVMDTTRPSAICQDTTIYLDATGNFTIDSSFIDNGSNDNCAVATITLSQYNFDCSHVGANNITMTVTDVNGNTNTCGAIVTVVDTTNPNAICQDTTIYLDATGNFTIDSSFIDDGSNDNCAVATITLGQYNFDCSHVGTNPVTMTVTDVNGNVSTCNANVVVIDTVNPNPICQNSTIYLDATGSFTIDSSYINNGSNDNCAVASITLSQYNFDCSHVGANNITMTVTDVNGNIDSCSATVTVMDTTRPSAICQDTTIYLDVTGNFTIDSSFIDNGSNDNCAVATITLSQYNFDCSHVGANNITMTVTDVNGNTNTCGAIVTVADTTNPNAICQDTTIYLDATGNFTIDSSFIDDGSNDNCAVATITLSQYSFDCSHVGTNPVTMTVTDVNGNVSTCNANVVVVDTVNPNPICQNSTIYLDATGNFTIDSSYIDNGSNDNCAVATITLSQYNFDCSHVGANNITMTVTDVNGNIDSCTATVTVMDTTRPSAICQDTTIYLDVTGNFTIDSSFIDNGSNDNCAVATITLSQYNFDCSHVGANNITMTVTDVNGNTNTCGAIVTVIDTVGPQAICTDTTIYLDATGNFTIDSSYIDGGSNDACGIYTLSQSAFNCTHVGANNVTLYVTDFNSNIDSCVAIVTVLDTINPTPVCQNTTIYLDATGSFTIDSSFINNGSTDNCAISTITLSQYTFDCSEVGNNNITMYVTDVNGNLDSCTATVTVIDTINPTPICQDTTIYLDATGTFTIDSSYIDNGSTDNCSIATITLSQYTFYCSEVGPNPVTMTVTDVNGNMSTCAAVVTVVDTVGPQAICTDTTIYLDATGNFTIDSSYIDAGSGDACGIYTLSQSDFDCSHVGANNVTLYVTDFNSNVDSCVAIVTVLDTINPVVNCQNITVYLDSTGQFTIDSSFIDNGSTDACGISTMSLSQSVFNCIDSGVNNITMTVTDVNGNIDSCIATVTVLDTIFPFVNAGINDSLCAVYTYNFNGNQPTGTFVGTWSVINAPNIPNIVNVNSYNSTVNNLIEGHYEFEWSITNGAGCNITRDTFSLDVFDQPISNAGTDTSLCNAYTMTLRGNLPAGTSTGQWSYVSPAPSVPVFSNINDYNSTIANLSEGDYQLVWTVRNGSCTPVTDTMNLHVYDQPFANGGNDIDLCNSYSSLLVATTPAGTATGTWSPFSGPNTPTFSSPNSPVTNISNLIEGTYRVLWTVSNGTCPPAVDTVIINVYDRPIAMAGIDTNLCAIYNLDLYGNQPLGTSTGRWIVDPSSTPPSNPIFVDSSIYNTNVSNLVEGTYRLLWVVSNGTCSPAVDSMLIHVWDEPIADVGPDTNLCSTYDLQFYATPLTGLSQGYWRLDPSHPNPNVPNIINAGLSNGRVTGLIEGTYRFVWEVGNGPCFFYTDTLTVNVYDQPTAIVGPDQDLCFENSTTISAVPVTGTASGQWYLANGFPNTPTFNNTSPTTTVGNMQEGGQYVFYWEATNGTCPASVDTIVINNYAVPVADFTQDTNEICAEQCVQFTNLSTIHPSGNIAGYFWNVDGRTVSFRDPEICFPNPGNFDVELIAVSDRGCRDTIERRDLIQAYTLPIADFNVFLSDDPNSSTTVQVQDQSSYAVTHHYTLGDGTSSSSPSFYHTYADSGFYDITQVVANSFGCTDTLTRTIFIHILIVYVPNTFTPDGDGTNDIFIPSVSGDDPDAYLFRVFNRWGEMIFQTQIKDKGWDGTYKGEPVKEDTYVWTLRTKYKDGERIQDYRGHVNVLR